MQLNIHLTGVFGDLNYFFTVIANSAIMQWRNIVTIALAPPRGAMRLGRQNYELKLFGSKNAPLPGQLNVLLLLNMGDGLIELSKVQQMGTSPLTPQKYLLTRSCQQLCRKDLSALGVYQHNRQQQQRDPHKIENVRFIKLRNFRMSGLQYLDRRQRQVVWY